MRKSRASSFWSGQRTQGGPCVASSASTERAESALARKMLRAAHAFRSLPPHRPCTWSQFARAAITAAGGLLALASSAAARSEASEGDPQLLSKVVEDAARGVVETALRVRGSHLRELPEPAETTPARSRA